MTKQFEAPALENCDFENRHFIDNSRTLPFAF